MKVITTTQCRRPNYTKQMLEYLGKCDGIGNYLILFSIDGGNEEVIGLCKTFDKCDSKTFINTTPLGVNKNTGYILEKGFEYTDCILHMEEDNILFKHALTIFDRLKLWWYPKIGSVSLYNSEARPKQYWNCISHRDLFVSVGPFGIKKDKFLAFKEAKCFEGYTSYDVNIDKYCRDNNYKHLYTMLGQSNNIGAEDGVHVPSAEWHKEFQFCEVWADTVDFKLNTLELI